MPWFRKKLLPGSKIIHIQKRWFSLLGMEFKTLYVDTRTPINVMKTKCVELERQITLLKSHIYMTEKEHKLEVKFMETKSKKHDRDGGAITQWKRERNPWYKFSLFQWGIDFVDEPLAFDPKTYSVRGGSRHERARNKSAEIAVNSFGEKMGDFKEQISDDAKDKAGKDDVLFYWECGKEDVSKHDKNKRKNETDEKYKERVAKLEGRLVK